MLFFFILVRGLGCGERGLPLQDGIPVEAQIAQLTQQAAAAMAQMLAEGSAAQRAALAQQLETVGPAGRGRRGHDLLYSVSIADGSVVMLTTYPYGSSGSTSVFDITPDSSTVLYVRRGFADQLYRIPITGGTATKLSEGLAATESVQDFELSLDSSQAIYYTQGTL